MYRKGFTLIELMVVVLIVAVLAAILIPMLTAKLEAARWSEGKAGSEKMLAAVCALMDRDTQSCPPAQSKPAAASMGARIHDSGKSGIK